MSRSACLAAYLHCTYLRAPACLALFAFLPPVRQSMLWTRESTRVCSYSFSPFADPVHVSVYHTYLVLESTVGLWVWTSKHTWQGMLTNVGLCVCVCVRVCRLRRRLLQARRVQQAERQTSTHVSAMQAVLASALRPQSALPSLLQGAASSRQTRDSEVAVVGHRYPRGTQV